MSADLILYNIGQLVTSREIENFQGSCMENIEIIIDGYVAVKDGLILDFGAEEVPKNIVSMGTKLIDMNGYVVTPGLIDTHTHLVHGGSREFEFPKILQEEKNILKTVEETKKLSLEKLVEKSQKHLNKMLSFGVTTVESKSGYGLELETELKQLEVNRILNVLQPIEIVSTFMGGHIIPETYKNREHEYIDEIIGMIKVIKEKNLAEFCDIFYNTNEFSQDGVRRILDEAKNSGFKLKIHSNELINIERIKLALELDILAMDHIGDTKSHCIELLKETDILANLFPGTSFFLRKDYAPGRKIIDSGIQVTLSTNYNPETCPTENLQLIMQIAAANLDMSAKEIFKAVTINSAKALDRDKICGSIEVGKVADIVVFDAPNIDYILYNFGVNHVHSVYKHGNIVYRKHMDI